MARPDRRERLLREIRSVLFREWDPIGVNDNPLVADEYDAYAPAIYRLLEAGADEVKLAAHLQRLRTGAMGPSDSVEEQEHDRRIARRLRGLIV